jgi:hypothetical protein
MQEPFYVETRRHLIFLLITRSPAKTRCIESRARVDTYSEEEYWEDWLSHEPLVTTIARI